MLTKQLRRPWDDPPSRTVERATCVARTKEPCAPPFWGKPTAVNYLFFAGLYMAIPKQIEKSFKDVVDYIYTSYFQISYFSIFLGVAIFYT